MSKPRAPNSADFTPEDYNIWLEMWQRLYQTKFHNDKELNYSKGGIYIRYAATVCHLIIPLAP